LFKDKNGLFDGEITGIMDTGELLIKDAEGKLRKYFFKEVEFVILT